ncbi:uncharacterized protein LOC144048776 isoform X4 [Vanacampus margaritifer]
MDRHLKEGDFLIGMKFPVDFLTNVSQAELEVSAHVYMNNLLYVNTDCPEQIILSDSTKVSVDISRVGYVPLYGSGDKKSILALFSPADPLAAVALYLLGKWWTVDNILKTSDLARDGIIEVTTIGERIVLYVLNRVIYRVREMNSEEDLPFLCHGGKDYAKICWCNGGAVGFYSVKPSGSLYNCFSTKRYQLPVMDSIFVRKCHRGDGFGLQMLKNFVLSFQHDSVGLRYPLTKAMYKMCEKYLCQYPEYTDLLWEVEGVGGLNQRFNIAKRSQTMDLRVSAGLLFTEAPHEVTTGAEKEETKEPIATQTKEAESMAYTIAIVEEMSVCTTTRDTGNIPVATQSRCSGPKKAKKADMIAECQSKKVIRIEDIEAETPEEHSCRNERPASFSDLVVTEGIFNSLTEEKTKDDVCITDEESVGVNTTLTPQEAEDAAALAAEESQGGDALMDTCCDPHMRIENVSEMKGVEEESREEDKALDDLHMTIDETFEEEDNSFSEGYDGEDKSTVLPLGGISKVALEEINKYGQVNPDQMGNEREVERPAEEVISMGKGGAPKAEEEKVKSLPEVNLEERKEVWEDENSEGMAEAATVAENLALELDTATVALEKDKPGGDQRVPPETEYSQEESTELPKLQEATVILVDLKTTHHQLSLKEVEKTEASVEYAELQKEETVLAPTGEKDKSSSDRKEAKPEKPETVSEEIRSEESLVKVYKTQTVKDGFAEKLNEETKCEIKEVPVVETRVLGSGRKKVETSCKSRSRSKKHQAEDNCDIPVNELNEAQAIAMEEEHTAVTKNTDQSNKTSISETSVNGKKDITVMVTTMEENSVSMMVTSDHVVQAKNPVPPLGEETELTAAQHQSAEMGSQISDQKIVNVVFVDQSVPKLTSAKNEDKNEKTNKGTTAEKNVTRSPVCTDSEQENLVMQCTKEADVQVIGQKGKLEDTHEFIQDNQEIYDQEGGLEEKAVDRQMETTELKIDIKKNTVIEEEVQQGQKEECVATQPKVATRDTADTLNDPAQESMKTQGTVEEHEQTQHVFSNIELGASAQETQVEGFTTVVDQSNEVKSSVEKKAGEDEKSATHEEMQVEQIRQLLKEPEDKCENGGTTERDEGEAVTQREECTEPNVTMKKDESMAHPETQEEGCTSIAKIDKRTTVSEAERVADLAIETRFLRKRKSTLTTQPRSKRAYSIRKKR